MKEPKWTEQDFTRWKQNEFTKLFFEYLQREVDNGEKALVNTCLHNIDIDTIRKISGGLLAIKNLLNIDINNLQIGEEDE
jgi:hypothetical protein